LEESIEHFNLEGIGKSPSKLDMSRILSMNEYYIKNISEDELYNHLVQYSELYKKKIPDEKEKKIKTSLTFLKNKAKTLEDIYNNTKYIIFDEVSFNVEDLKLIDNKAKKIILEFSNRIKELKKLSKEILEPILNDLIKTNETNFKGVGQPLRIALTGSKFGPGVYDIIVSLGKEETIKRLRSKIFS
jgi:glutamyl-tRNA synthetase